MNRKLMKAAVITLAMLCALVTSFFLVFHAVRQAIIEDNEILGHAIAQSLLPALLVNDTQQVETLLKALESYPSIESAELVSAEGSTIAIYAKAAQPLDPMSASFELASAQNDPNQVHVMAPITFDGLIVANLHIAVNLWPTYLRIILWLGVLTMLLSVIYILIKKPPIKIRLEKTLKGSDSDQGEFPFNINETVSIAMLDADISLEYLPIQHMNDASIFGMEVVVCWRHPSGETLHIAPSNFMALSEKSGICLPFDDWLLDTALTRAAGWQHQYGPLILSIRISENQFKDPAFAQKILTICARTQYPYQLLELEVSEAVIARQIKHALACIQSFATQGLSVTVGHFGLGRNSLDLLDVLPIHKIRLDRKLIKNMGNDALIFQLVQTTITRALSNEVQVVVDGLEVSDQYKKLQNMGCLLGQGAYFHPPLSAAEFESFLADRPFEKSTAHTLILDEANNRQISAGLSTI